MDIYSDMHVPFNVAVWCRSHPYSPKAVEITRALKSIAQTKEAIATFEQRLDEGYARLSRACAVAQQELEGSKNGY